jgi:hypothetical protein
MQRYCVACFSEICNPARSVDHIYQSTRDEIKVRLLQLALPISLVIGINVKDI